MKHTLVFRLVSLVLCARVLAGCQAHDPAGQPPAHQRFTDAETRECDANTRWVDRVEGAWAILVSDAGDELPFPLRSLPAGLREGEVLRGGRRDLRCGALLRARIHRLLGPPHT